MVSGGWAASEPAVRGVAARTATKSVDDEAGASRDLVLPGTGVGPSLRGHDEYPTDEADRGRHPGFASVNVLAGGPGSLSLSFGDGGRSGGGEPRTHPVDQAPPRRADLGRVAADAGRAGRRSVLRRGVRRSARSTGRASSGRGQGAAATARADTGPAGGRGGCAAPASGSAYRGGLLVRGGRVAATRGRVHATGPAR